MGIPLSGAMQLKGKCLQVAIGIWHTMLIYMSAYRQIKLVLSDKQLCHILPLAYLLYSQKSCLLRKKKTLGRKFPLLSEHNQVSIPYGMINTEVTFINGCNILCNCFLPYFHLEVDRICIRYHSILLFLIDFISLYCNICVKV